MWGMGVAVPGIHLLRPVALSARMHMTRAPRLLRRRRGAQRSEDAEAFLLYSWNSAAEDEDLFAARARRPLVLTQLQV